VVFDSLRIGETTCVRISSQFRAPEGTCNFSHNIDVVRRSFPRPAGGPSQCEASKASARAAPKPLASCSTLQVLIFRKSLLRCYGFWGTSKRSILGPSCSSFARDPLTNVAIRSTLVCGAKTESFRRRNATEAPDWCSHSFVDSQVSGVVSDGDSISDSLRIRCVGMGCRNLNSDV